MSSYRPIGYEDGDKLVHYLPCERFVCSEMAFNNLYLWRKGWKIELTTLEGVTLLRGRDRHGSFLFPPYAKSVEAAANALRISASRWEDGDEMRVCCIPKLYAMELNDALGGEAVMQRDRDNDDYVYETKNLIELTGKKYHAKRNHINRFNANYESEYIELTDDTKDSFIECADRWFADKQEAQGAVDTILLNERDAIKEAVSEYKRLNLKGGGIAISGRIEALSIGQMLTCDMALIHFEKANTAIDGLYSVINQRFAMEAFSHTKYINREEDMGIEGLRKAKLSYHPAFLIEKCALTLKRR